MLRIFDGQSGISRREWIRLAGWGGLAGLGLRGAAPPAAAAAAAVPNSSRDDRGPGFGRARSVILVYASGGQSQIDMWDPKPQAPADIRGAFAPIGTRLTGVHFCQHIPKIAALADRFTTIRSMSHEDLDHGSATYLALTGHYHPRRSSNPPPSANDFPTYGAVLQQVRRERQFLYDSIHLNGPALVPFEASPGQNGGFLGRGVEPLVVGDVSRQDFALPDLTPRGDLPHWRLQQRFDLKRQLDGYLRGVEQHGSVEDLQQIYGRALSVLSSRRCREAFDLGQEPAATRDRYGRHRSGQACLLARRLVEAGVPFINVIWNHSNRGQDRDPLDTDVYGWDTHNDIFKSLKTHLLPRFDESFSALIEDLDDRGLLDETLVVCMGEFGRAPKVALEPNFKGSTPGRKHWAGVYSIVMAGAGVSRGKVVGASDRLGGEPVTDYYGPWDVAATMFAALGIDPGGHFHDTLNRPFPITTGKPIAAIY